MKLELPSPGMPGQPMYYVIPAKAANADAGEEVHRLRRRARRCRPTASSSSSTGIRASIRSTCSRSSTPAAWNKLFTDITPARSRRARAGRSRCRAYFNDIVEGYERVGAELRRAIARRSAHALADDGAPIVAARARRRAPLGAALAARRAGARSSSALFFVFPLVLSRASARFAARTAASRSRISPRRSSSTRSDIVFTRRDRRAVDAADRARRDRDRRLPDARREPARRRAAALALSLAAVHSVRRRRAGACARSSPRTAC